MASEIERLPDLEGFLKLASAPDWQVVRLTPMSEPAPIRARKPSVVASPTPVAEVPVPKSTHRRKAAGRRAPTPRHPAGADSAALSRIAARAEDAAAVENRPQGAE